MSNHPPKYFALVLAVALAFACAPLDAGTITYSYAGQPFTTIAPGYACPPVCNVTGSFTVAQTLGPNLTLAEIIPASFALSSGGVTLTDTVYGPDSGGLFVSTDSGGSLVGWTWAATGPASNPSARILTQYGPDDPTYGSVTYDDVRLGDQPPPIVGPIVGINYGAPGAWSSHLDGFNGGTPNAPVLLFTGVGIAVVTGAISGQNPQDYYSFDWFGGDFSVTATMTNITDQNAAYQLSEGSLGSCTDTSSTALNSTDSFSGTIVVHNLAPGQYCVGLATADLADPNFTLNFNTPLTDAPVPEPASFVLLAVGLGALALTQRRRAVR